MIGVSLERATEIAGVSFKRATEIAGVSLERATEIAGVSLERTTESAVKELSKTALEGMLWIAFGSVFCMAFAEVGPARKRKDHLMVQVITIMSLPFWFCAAMKLKSLSSR